MYGKQFLAVVNKLCRQDDVLVTLTFLSHFGEAKLRSLIALMHLLGFRLLKFPTSPKARKIPR